MDDLIAGYRRFRAGLWQRERERYAELAAEGQRPRAMVIACSDSRADPATIFNARPGELFVVRNVANLVPPYMPDSAYHGTSAAVEFGVRVLGVQHLIVLGHAQCGGIQALLNGAPAEVGDFVENWITIAEPARRKVLSEQAEVDPQTACEHEAIRLSLANLVTFPWIRQAVEAGRLRLHGCYFGIASGELERMGDDGVFRSVPAG
jgi:carbonic anhydrase